MNKEDNFKIDKLTISMYEDHVINHIEYYNNRIKELKSKEKISNVEKMELNILNNIIRKCKIIDIIK
jgi:hypothetical protein